MIGQCAVRISVFGFGFLEFCFSWMVSCEVLCLLIQLFVSGPLNFELVIVIFLPPPCCVSGYAVFSLHIFKKSFSNISVHFNWSLFHFLILRLCHLKKSAKSFL